MNSKTLPPPMEGVHYISNIQVVSSGSEDDDDDDGRSNAGPSSDKCSPTHPLCIAPTPPHAARPQHRRDGDHSTQPSGSNGGYPRRTSFRGRHTEQQKVGGGRREADDGGAVLYSYRPHFVGDGSAPTSSRRGSGVVVEVEGSALPGPAPSSLPPSPSPAPHFPLAAEATHAAPSSPPDVPGSSRPAAFNALHITDENMAHNDDSELGGEEEASSARSAADRAQGAAVPRVCPFTFVGCCVVGHHTGQELRSPETVHDHMMAMARLLQDSRAAQQALQERVRALEELLERQQRQLHRLTEGRRGTSASVRGEKEMPRDISQFRAMADDDDDAEAAAAATTRRRHSGADADTTFAARMRQRTVSARRLYRSSGSPAPATAALSDSESHARWGQDHLSRQGSSMAGSRAGDAAPAAQHQRPLQRTTSAAAKGGGDAPAEERMSTRKVKGSRRTRDEAADAAGDEMGAAGEDGGKTLPRPTESPHAATSAASSFAEERHARRPATHSNAPGGRDDSHLRTDDDDDNDDSTRGADGAATHGGVTARPLPRLRVSCFESFQVRESSVSTISSASCDYFDEDDAHVQAGVVQQIHGIIGDDSGLQVSAPSTPSATAYGSFDGGHHHHHNNNRLSDDGDDIRGSPVVCSVTPNTTTVAATAAARAAATLSPPSIPSLISNTKPPSQLAAARPPPQQLGPHGAPSITASLPRMRPSSPSSAGSTAGGMATAGAWAAPAPQRMPTFSGVAGSAASGPSTPASLATVAAFFAPATTLVASAVRPPREEGCPTRLLATAPMQRPPLIRRGEAAAPSPSHTGGREALSTLPTNTTAAAAGKSPFQRDDRGDDHHATSLIHAKGAPAFSFQADEESGEGGEDGEMGSRRLMHAPYKSEANLRNMQR